MSRGVAINSHTNHIIRANKKHAVLNPVMEKKMVKFCVTNSLSKSGTAAVKFIELLGQTSSASSILIPTNSSLPIWDILMSLTKLLTAECLAP